MQKSRESLQNQLESYSVASKGLRVPKNWKGAGSMLATVTGSALALATNANASIIYSGIQDITVSEPAGPGANDAAGFTIGGAPWQVIASNFTAPLHSTARAELRLLAPGEAFMASSTFTRNVKKLASGAVISGGQLFDHFFSFPYLRRKNNFSFTGQFLNSSKGFVGVRFNIGGNPHFGWIRVHDTIGPGNAVTTTAIDWAYNDVAGAPILAGAGAVPEPSTKSMVLLAAGAAGVLAWRRRRKQITAQLSNHS